MGKSSGGGQTPDLVGAAREEGEQARQTAREETIANRPNQYNPWGSTTWNLEQVQDPRTGQMIDQWTQTESLNPQLEAALQSQFGQTAERSDLAGNIFSDFAAGYQPIDFSQFGDVQQFEGAEGIGGFEYDPGTFRQTAEDAAYQRATSRLDPQFEQQQQALETKLRNQGLRPGDQAWDSAMQNFGRTRTDAYEQARLGATAEGRSEAQQMYEQALGGYQANLAGQGQQFQQDVASNQIANQLRQQQMQEALQQQGYPLDLINQIMSGYGIQGSSPSGSMGG